MPKTIKIKQAIHNSFLLFTVAPPFCKFRNFLIPLSINDSHLLRNCHLLSLHNSVNGFFKMAGCEIIFCKRYATDIRHPKLYGWLAASIPHSPIDLDFLIHLPPFYNDVSLYLTFPVVLEKLRTTNFCIYWKQLFLFCMHNALCSNN